MKYEYTIHAEEKLKSPESKKLNITKRKIEKIVQEPIIVDRSEEPVQIAIGNLSKTLSLCVVYKKVNKKVRIITFYPAEKGRYEHKVLRRG